jgi:hypothetical protein
MKLALYRREQLHSGDAQNVGDATADQFQRTHAAIGAWSDVEHTDDGRHGDITADSIAVSGDATVGGDLAVGGDGAIGGDLTVGGDGAIGGDLDVGGAVSADGLDVTGDVSAGDGHVVIGDLPPVAPSVGGYGIALDPWRIVADRSGSGAPSALLFQYLTEPGGEYLFRVIRNAVYDWALHALPGIGLALGSLAQRLSAVFTNSVDALYNVTVGSWRVLNLTTAPGSGTYPALAVQWLPEGGGPQVCLFRLGPADWILGPAPGNALRIGGNGFPVTTVDAGQLYTSLGVYERSRPFPMGEWQDVPYSPGLFSTSGGAAWTVGAGACYYRYALVGKTLTVQFMFAPTSVAAGAGVSLQVQLPPGLTFAANGVGKPWSAVAYALHNSAQVMAWTQANTPTVWACVLAVGWAADPTTYLYGTFTAEIA